MKEAHKSEETLESMNLEYSKLCTQAGHVQYQISVLQKDLTLINEQMRELNLKAAKLQAKEEKKDE